MKLVITICKVGFHDKPEGQKGCGGLPLPGVPPAVTSPQGSLDDSRSPKAT
jgi:hypothetical protein